MKQFNLNEYLYKPNRRIVTREGKEAKILFTKCRCEDYPLLVGIIDEDGKMERSFTCTIDGKEKGYIESKDDLFFMMEKHTLWLVIYEFQKEYQARVFKSQQEAKSFAGGIPIQQVEFEDFIENIISKY